MFFIIRDAIRNRPLAASGHGIQCRQSLTPKDKDSVPHFVVRLESYRNSQALIRILASVAEGLESPEEEITKFSKKMRLLIDSFVSRSSVSRVLDASGKLTDVLHSIQDALAQEEIEQVKFLSDYFIQVLST